MMRIIIGGLVAVILGALTLGILVSAGWIDLSGAPEPPATFASSAGPLKVDRVDGPLAQPTALAFLPGGGLLIAERGGTLWHRGADGTRGKVSGVPAVMPKGQGGLLDIVAARDFATSREVFLAYAEPAGAGSRLAVATARLANDGKRLETLKVIFRQPSVLGSDGDYGGRIAEAKDGTLWVTSGDRGKPLMAQNLTNDLGKVLRIGRDGTIPEDNPMVMGFGRKEIWSFGHRDPVGAAVDPAGGRLWIVEDGPKGGDKVNEALGAKNYGWPTTSFRKDSASAGDQSANNWGMVPPKWSWDPGIRPSGLMIYSGRLWPQWKGDLFVGALKPGLIGRLTRKGDRITGEERLLAGAFGPVHDLAEGPKGAIWFVTGGKTGALYRVGPAK